MSEMGPRIERLLDALDIVATNTLVEVMEGFETLLVYCKNLILYPDEKKYRKVKKSNVHYQQRLGHLKGAEESMIALGYVPNGMYLRLQDKDADRPSLEELKTMEHVLSTKLEEVREQFNALPVRIDDSHVFSAIKAASCHSEIGKRNNMEDDELIVDKFTGDPDMVYVGLYDGHGGRATVDFVVKTLHMNLEQQMKLHPEKPFSELYKNSYLATDGQLRRQNILRSGSTSVTCVIQGGREDGLKKLYTANVGDSRALLLRDGVAIRLTIDHKASDPDEAKRIEEAGGFIGRNKRVNGVLAISRALGDHMLKENDVISAEPYCVETDLCDADTHLVLACDGLWDVMTDQEAVDLMIMKLNEIKKVNETAPKDKKLSSNEMLKKTSQALVHEAIARRSLDNVTVMLVEL